MTRLDELRRFTDKSALGLEIAPYFNPIAPKAQGYNAMILDVFDTERLRENALSDTNIPKDRIQEIEDVDIVSDASALGDVVTARGLAGQFSYIVSSHNFEHLPDPIRFLQGCFVALKPGGMLTMAVPDYRACFDYFRMPTRLSDWLGAYHEGRKQPSPQTRFDSAVNSSVYKSPHGDVSGCDINHDNPMNFVPYQNLRAAYATFIAEPGPYTDTHCSVVFGDTFELMVRDLLHLGLLDCEVVAVTETRYLEFFVHLRKPLEPGASLLSDADHYAQRDVLLRRINAKLGLAGYPHLLALPVVLHPATPTAEVIPARQEPGLKAALRSILGDQTMQHLSALNRKVRGRRQRHNP